MKFSQLILSEILKITIIALCLALWCIFAVLAGVEWHAIVATVIFVVFILAVWLSVRFFIVKKRTEKLNRMISELEEGYLLGETLPRPYDAVEQQYYAIMKRVSRSAIDVIGQLEGSQEEYRDFIEKWIHEIKTPLTSCALLIKNGGDPVKVRGAEEGGKSCRERFVFCSAAHAECGHKNYKFIS